MSKKRIGATRYVAASVIVDWEERKNMDEKTLAALIENWLGDKARFSGRLRRGEELVKRGKTQLVAMYLSKCSR